MKIIQKFIFIVLRIIRQLLTLILFYGKLGKNTKEE